MPIVRRANVVLDVQDYEVEMYMNKGFSVIDEVGKVLQEAPPHDTTMLKDAYIRQKKQIEDLRTELNEAYKDIEVLKHQIKTAKKKKEISQE